MRYGRTTVEITVNVIAFFLGMLASPIGLGKPTWPLAIAAAAAVIATVFGVLYARHRDRVTGRADFVRKLEALRQAGSP